MDNDLKKEIRPFIQKAHPVVKDFISSGDMEDALDEILSEFAIEKEEVLDIENTVLMILLGLKDPATLASDIETTTSFSKSISEDIANSVENIILATIASKIGGSVSTKETSPIETKQIKNIGVGNSFEQIIANQANAMRPAGIQVPNYSNVKANNQAPHNLPTEEEVQKKINSYTSGNDPYREPLA